MVKRLSISSLVATWLLLAVTLASAQDKPDKPTINPQTDSTKLEAGLKANIKQSRGKYSDWAAGWIPEACKEFATEKKLNPADFEVRNVWYDDCSEPWIMCRHKQMGMSKEELILLVSRIPVKARSFIRHFIGVPELGGGLAGLWYSSGDVILVNKPTLRTTLHETSHALDWEVPRRSGSKESVSATAAWKAALAADQSVATDYSRNGFPDNFAETGVMGFYDAYVKGGFAGLQPAAGQIKNQLGLFRKSMGDNIMQGGNCTKRIPNSKAVAKGATGGARIRALLYGDGEEWKRGEKPDVGFHDPNVGEYDRDDDNDGKTVFEAPVGEAPDTSFHDPNVGTIDRDGDDDGKTVFQCGHDHEHY